MAPDLWLAKPRIACDSATGASLNPSFQMGSATKVVVWERARIATYSRRGLTARRLFKYGGRSEWAILSVLGIASLSNDATSAKRPMGRDKRLIGTMRRP